MTLELFPGIQRGAIISDCGNYRYRLWRIWNEEKPKVLFIMLNPSTADEVENDRTIRKCIRFANGWGYGGLYVGNLFAYRSTDPKHLLEVENPFGENNNDHLMEMSAYCKVMVCAWGNQKILDQLSPDKDFINNLDITKKYIELSLGGTPKHPLYLKSDSKLNGFKPRQV